MFDAIPGNKEKIEQKLTLFALNDDVGAPGLHLAHLESRKMRFLLD